MSQRNPDPTAGVTRLNGLLSWWGLAGTTVPISRQASLTEAQRLAGAMGRIVADATAAQAGLMREAGVRNAQSLSRIMFARKRCELVEAQSRLIADCAGDASSQAEIWSDLMQALRRETARSIDHQDVALQAQSRRIDSGHDPAIEEGGG